MRDCRKTEAGDNAAGDTDSKTAKVLAPEDVRIGDYVAVLHVVWELPSYMWRDESIPLPIDEPVRVPLMPKQGGLPLKVRSVCLPFVLVKTPSGGLRNLDVRRELLARLDRDLARIIWKACKKRRAKQARPPVP